MHLGSGSGASVAERPQSAARNFGFSIGTDFIASPLHCFVRPALIGSATDQWLSVGTFSPSGLPRPILGMLNHPPNLRGLAFPMGRTSKA